jgi:hypothetical protein
MAKGHETYKLFFDTSKEAHEISMNIYNHFKDDFRTKPMVFLTGRNTKRTMGTASPWSGRIRLHNSGANVGCLIHELAHLFKSASKHSRSFKFAQQRILTYWATIKDDFTENLRVIERDPKQDAMNDIFRKRATVHFQNLAKFNYGDRVYFDSTKRGAGRIVGTVLRVNTKTISVQADGEPKGSYWRVSPGMLNHLEDKVVKPVLPKEVEYGVPEDEMPKPTDVPKIKAAREDVIDTDEEIRDMIEFAIEKLSKYAVHGTLSMSGIVRTFHARGIMNNDDNRAYAIKYVKELGLKIR